jgi:hypothetical protein
LLVLYRADFCAVATKITKKGIAMTFGIFVFLVLVAAFAVLFVAGLKRGGTDSPPDAGHDDFFVDDESRSGMRYWGRDNGRMTL